MLGVMRETLEREGGSIRGEDDFFSVARTTPLVAACVVNINEFLDILYRAVESTFDSQ